MTVTSPQAVYSGGAGCPPVQVAYNGPPELGYLYRPGICSCCPPLRTALPTGDTLQWKVGSDIARDGDSHCTFWEHTTNMRWREICFLEQPAQGRRLQTTISSTRLKTGDPLSINETVEECTIALGAEHAFTRQVARLMEQL